MGRSQRRDSQDAPNVRKRQLSKKFKKFEAQAKSLIHEHELK